MARGIVTKTLVPETGRLEPFLEYLTSPAQQGEWVYPQGSTTKVGYALTVGNTLPATSYTASAVLK